MPSVLGAPPESILMGRLHKLPDEANLATGISGGYTQRHLICSCTRRGLAKPPQMRQRHQAALGRWITRPDARTVPALAKLDRRKPPREAAVCRCAHAKSWRNRCSTSAFISRSAAPGTAGCFSRRAGRMAWRTGSSPTQGDRRNLRADCKVRVAGHLPSGEGSQEHRIVGAPRRIRAQRSPAPAATSLCDCPAGGGGNWPQQACCRKADLPSGEDRHPARDHRERQGASLLLQQVSEPAQRSHRTHPLI